MFCTKFTAHIRENGGICPIAVGCTIRRLASTCACLHVIHNIPGILPPLPVGIWIPGGVEAAVYTTRMYLHNLPSNKTLYKVDTILSLYFGILSLFLSYYMSTTSSAFQTPLLISWDQLLAIIYPLYLITNINFQSDDPCLFQATLPVWPGGLGT